MKSTTHMLAFILVIIGGLNWGLWGFFKLDLVSMLLGGYTTIARVVYGLVGVSAVYMLFTMKGKSGRRRKR